MGGLACASAVLGQMPEWRDNGKERHFAKKKKKKHFAKANKQTTKSQFKPGEKQTALQGRLTSQSFSSLSTEGPHLIALVSF